MAQTKLYNELDLESFAFRQLLRELYVFQDQKNWFNRKSIEYDIYHKQGVHKIFCKKSHDSHDLALIKKLTNINCRLQHMKNKGMQQLHALPQNSEARLVKSCKTPTKLVRGGVR